MGLVTPFTQSRATTCALEDYRTSIYSTCHPPTVRDAFVVDGLGRYTQRLLPLWVRV